MQPITNLPQEASRRRRVSLRKVSLKRRKKASRASRRALTKANDKIKREDENFSLLLYRVPHKQAQQFMQQAAICLMCLAGFQYSTGSKGQPGTYDNIHSNSISDCVPKSHTGGLILHFLPVSGKDEEGRGQSNPKADKNDSEASKTPGSLILNNIYRHAINPAQDNAHENTDEYLYFGIGILLLGC
jgi:hypothetical protein